MTASLFVRGLASGYEIEHLVRVFFPGAETRVKLPAEKQETVVYARAGTRRLAAGYRQGGRAVVRCLPRPAGEAEVKTALARLVYELLKEETGLRPPWGMLTGVRPVRLLRKLEAGGGITEAKKTLVEKYDVSYPKTELAGQVAEVQAPVLRGCEEKDYSLYLAIPFCPSRCSYCSFVSQSIEKEAGLLEPYLEKLEEELALTGELAKEVGLRLRSIYMGGGTPTVLSAAQMDRLLGVLARHFAPGEAGEYTVEAGRPDCTTLEKLQVLKAHGVTRVSVNPQSMNGEVLQAIGRRHGPEEVLRCVEDARKAGFSCLNMDLIAGLPKDSTPGFENSLRQLLALEPENLTLHSLTLKRGSRLKQEAEGGGAAAEMLERAYPALQEAGYRPYYLYRQKNTPENLENTGWTKPGHEGLYNIYIMEEVQTILSVGAGGVTKLVAGQGRLMRRFFNDKYPLDYLRNFEKIKHRKIEMRDVYAGLLDSEATC